MGYEVVREVTQPVHGADGAVTHRPGERFGLDVPLPEGVPFRLAVAEVETPAAEPPQDESPPADGRPSVNAPKADWVDYAVGAGTDRETAESMTKLDLLAQFGPKADPAWSTTSSPA